MMQFQTQSLKSTLGSIPDGAAGTSATLKLMRSLVREYKTSLPIRTLAVQIVQQFPQKDYRSEVVALQQWVRDKIRYVKDVTNVETLQTPEVTLKMRAGDCDDKSTLLASMLEATGHATRFVAIGFQPGEYEHVYVESRIGSMWIPLETTEPVEIGWQPKNIMARMTLDN